MAKTTTATHERANALGKLNISLVEIKSVHKKVYRGLFLDFAFALLCALLFLHHRFNSCVPFTHKHRQTGVGEKRERKRDHWSIKKLKTKFIWINSKKINRQYFFSLFLPLHWKYKIYACEPIKINEASVLYENDLNRLPAHQFTQNAMPKSCCESFHIKRVCGCGCVVYTIRIGVLLRKKGGPYYNTPSAWSSSKVFSKSFFPPLQKLSS